MSNEKQTSSDQKTPETLLEIIQECGRLKFTIDKTLNVLCLKFQDENREYLKERLTTPGTEEYITYHSGQNLGDFEINSALHKAASSGDADAAKQLKEIQNSDVIDRAIRQTFFGEES